MEVISKTLKCDFIKSLHPIFVDSSSLCLFTHFACFGLQNMASDGRVKSIEFKKIVVEERYFICQMKYSKVAISILSCLVAHSRIFRLFLKGKFDAHVL